MNILIEFEKKPLFFINPSKIIRVDHPEDLSAALDSIESLNRQGYFIAGFLSYEAGYAFEDRLKLNKKYDFPLLYMAAYKKPLPVRPVQPNKKFTIEDISINQTKRQYSKNIAVIRNHIACGDVYQITYCLKLKFKVKGSTYNLYRRLLHEQPIPYPAYIETDDFTIASLSPERFFHKKNNFILTEPMKGTWPRGSNLKQDKNNQKNFQCDKKNRAENVMIADLLRNDLGRMAKKIKAPHLFKVTPYATLFQMTSIVTATIDRRISLNTILKAIFPSGSVTGAPKIKSMQIIRNLENEERKIYTGAIGYITPKREFYFSIPIRTLLLKKGLGEMGIGGGIVWDSTAEGEWDEGMLKARFLTDLAVK